MTKTFTPKPGDKWTRYREQTLWLYRGEDAFVFHPGGHGLNDSPASLKGRSPIETALPTPDALAQLREWGYVVTGDELVTQTITPSGMVIETRYVFPGEFKIDPPITEARVREIVAQMLAAQPNPAEVREAIAIANDPNTKWHNISTKIVDPEKEAVAPKPTAERLLADLVEAWNATYPLEAKLPESVLPFVNSPALAAARGYLAREYFASTKGMVK